MTLLTWDFRFNELHGRRFILIYESTTEPISRKKNHPSDTMQIFPLCFSASGSPYLDERVPYLSMSPMGVCFFVASLAMHAAMAFVFALMFEVSSLSVEPKRNEVCRKLDDGTSMTMDICCRLKKLERSRPKDDGD